MGQKGNLITLRRKKQFLNLSSLNNQFFLDGINLLNRLKNLLNKKNIVLTNEFLNIQNNKLYLNCKLLFQTNKIKLFRRKKNTFKSQKKYYKIVNVNQIICTLFTKIVQKYNINCLFLSFDILNKKVNLHVFKILFKKLKKNVSVLFERQKFLFYDFLKITSLYYEKKIKIDVFSDVLAKIFSFLQKKRHSKFFSFLKQLFTILIVQIPENLKFSRNNFQGIKLIIKGRLKGKPKASSFYFQLGKIPVQSMSKKIDYYHTKAYTNRYGVFGFKFWIFNDC